MILSCAISTLRDDATRQNQGHREFFRTGASPQAAMPDHAPMRVRVMGIADVPGNHGKLLSIEKWKGVLLSQPRSAGESIVRIRDAHVPQADTRHASA